MSTLKVNTIQDTTGNDALTIDSSGNVTASQGFVPSTQLSHRNLIINGAMQVAQRGTSFSDANGYTLDRWKTYKNGAVAITTSQESDAPDGFAKSLKVACSTADTTVDSGDYVILQYNIEGLDLQHLNYGSSSAKSITMSFWVKSNLTGDVTVTNEVNLGPPYSGKYFTINSANTWEYKTLTWSGNTTDSIDNDNSTGIELQMWLHAGATFTGGTYTDDTWHSTGSNRVKSNFNFANSTSNTFQITGVQLEVGSVATPFEHRSYGEELARCYRYYQDYSVNAPYSAIFLTKNGYYETNAFYYPVEMRDTPTVSTGDVFIRALNSSSNLSYSGLSITKTRKAVHFASSTTNNSTFYTFIVNALKLDAEL